jgi:alpha-tubulin suppressor-like RCC1 family protein
MPNFYNYRENGVVYSFDDVFVPADAFRQGTLFTWGDNFSGRLGDNTTNTRSTPVQVFGSATNWKQVSGGRDHTAAIKTDGTLWNWGRGQEGQLGGNTPLISAQRNTPVTTFAGGTNWKQVAGGYRHTAAIKTDGTLWTWGNNSSGQLGDNALGTNRCTPVTTFAGGTNWKQVACGREYTAAIKTDGTLWSWGNNASGQLGRNPDNGAILTPVTTFAGGTNWADTATTDPAELYTLSAGTNFTAAIKTDGTLWTWGGNAYGRLGDNTTTNRSTPVTTFAGGTNWKQVFSGDRHTAAIKTDGTLWTWGNQGNGALGDNTTTQRITPVTTFAGGTNWKQVACASIRFNFTVAIKTDGTLWTWGRNFNGQLGDNTTTQRITPVTTFAGGTDWKQVTCGDTHTSAIKTDGTLWTWGRNTEGQLGDNTATDRLTPVTTFTGGTNWKQVAGGGYYTAAIKTDGTLWTWGRNTSGQIGDNTIIQRSTPVTTTAGGSNWKQVSCKGSYTAAIKTDGTLWTWGLGTSGQLGDNTTTSRSNPVTTFAGGTNWKQVSGGSNHTAALNDDGVNKRLYLWGSNANQQLGIFYINQDVIPNQTFAGGTNWKQVTCGNGHTAAVKTDGTLWTWGNNSAGHLGDNTTTQRTTPVTTFAGGTNWKQVSTFGNVTAAIKTDGTLWTWGINSSRQLGDNTTTQRNTPVTTFAGGTDWKQVTGGDNHTAAIKTDGTLWTWGRGTQGQLGNNSTAVSPTNTPITTFAGGTNWKQVFCGGYHTAATTYIDNYQ